MSALEDDELQFELVEEAKPTDEAESDEDDRDDDEDEE